MATDKTASDNTAINTAINTGTDADAIARFDPVRPEAGARLIVYIDFKSPYAFIAVAPTYALAESLGITIDWRPLILDIPSYLGSARLDDAGKVAESQRTPEQWSNVRYAYQDARRYAKLSGYMLRGTTKIWDSSLAGIGMLWAKANGAPVLRRYTQFVYERFWRRELDIENPDVIIEVLREAGASQAKLRDFLADEGRTFLDATQPQIFDAGIFGVPTYILDGEMFFGREHLPLLRWKLLSWKLIGEQGAPPDIAYESIAPRAKTQAGT